MAVFPKTKLELISFAGGMLEGFTKNPEIFPDPTVSIVELHSAAAVAQAKNDAKIELTGKLKKLTEEEDDAFLILRNMVKADIDYAESVTRNNPEDLTLIGWGTRRPATKTQAPDPATKLIVSNPQPNTVRLQWESPSKGDRPKFYKVSRQKNDEDIWELVESTTSTKIDLNNQPSDVKLEYRVISENNAGPGIPSNTVSIIL